MTLYGSDTKLLFKTCLSAFFLISSAFCTSYAPPQNREVVSENGKYMLYVDSKKGVHTVFDISGVKKQLWNFKHSVWHFPFLISNDGKTVVTISWRHVQDKNGVEKTPIKDKTAVIFWRDGKEWKSYKFDKVFPNPPQTKNVGVGPIGDFWRTWYHDVAVSGDTFSILLTNDKIKTFSFTSGEIIDNPEKKLFPVQKEHEIKVRYLQKK